MKKVEDITPPASDTAATPSLNESLTARIAAVDRNLKARTALIETVEREGNDYNLFVQKTLIIKGHLNGLKESIKMLTESTLQNEPTKDPS